MNDTNAQVSVRILDKEYQVACPASERTDLLDSAEVLNSKMREIRDSGRIIGLDRIAVMAALEQRHRTGKGQEITTSLFETTAFLVGQHMAQYAVTGTPVPPMPARVSAWAIYDVFETGDDSQIFVGVVSDGQWTNFCEAFELTEFSSDRSLDENNARVAERDRILPVILDLFKQYDKQTLMAKLEEMGMPFAPISKPEELFDDPHLAAGGGL
ncbi:MAG: cell division protein ZapA, partial [Proteobacteria bacterium]|nr:cell division protein ZapA [Pseudomonadota bacterium]